ncbi:hypothetical protein [Streptomyces sp. NPDC046759]|uniref:hypothetical protein n=1 Tax=Streptomyces sp. NPDC046759 TaxID=3155019 RepID=UPI0033FBD311
MIVPQPAAATARARIRHPVRPAVLVAVLLGLFLMHGGPAAAWSGCHGAMPDTAVAPMAPARPAGHPAGRAATAHGTVHHKATPYALSGTAAPRSAHSAATAARPGAHMGEPMQGALCLATTTRSVISPHPPLAAAGLVFPAVVVLPWARRRSGGTRRRGPPGGGRLLLLQVCVART